MKMSMRTQWKDIKKYIINLLVIHKEFYKNILKVYSVKNWNIVGICKKKKSLVF